MCYLAYELYLCVCVHAQLCLTLCNPMDLSMGVFRQEYWSGLPFFLQGTFPTKGSKLQLLCLLHWQVDSLPLNHLESPMISI